MEPIQGINQASSGKDGERKGLLTIGEIADYLRISEKTLYKWSSQGRIPCIKFSNRCVRFDIEKVRDWYASMEQKGRKTKRVKVAD